jgi:hypothetical protein
MPSVFETRVEFETGLMQAVSKRRRNTPEVKTLLME